MSIKQGKKAQPMNLAKLPPEFTKNSNDEDKGSQ
jgi:hypothetical protein